MKDALNLFFFGVYPYVALTVFFLGSLIRFEREQYTWKSDSSQMLRQGNLRWGSNLFHIGIISLFLTHFVGLLTPAPLYHALGVTTELKQLMAVIVGAILGIMCLVGLLLLIHRRWSEYRLSHNSKVSDWVTLIWILIVLCMGLATLFTSAQHPDGAIMELLADWAQAIVTLRPEAAVAHMIPVPLVYHIHMVLGMTLFVIFPFTRLVHVWSGFGSVTFLVRPWQLVRPRR